MILTKLEKTERAWLYRLGLKKCYSCNKIKFLFKFRVDNRSVYGTQSRCKSCLCTARPALIVQRKLNKVGLRCCYVCGNIKKLCEFSKNSYSCKICANDSRKKHYENNRDKTLAVNKLYRSKNKEKISKEVRKYRIKNKDKIKTRYKKYYLDNKEKIRKDNKIYRNKNKVRIRNSQVKYREENSSIIQRRKKIYSYSNCISSSYVNKINQKNIVYYAKFSYGKTIVKCYSCEKYYNPTNKEVMNFLYAESGYMNIYCSDKCKQLCKVYGFNVNQIDPESKLYKSKSEQQQTRACQTDHLKQLQIDEVGYNYCEKCAVEVEIVELHHTLEVAKFGLEAVNSASHLLVCNICHKEFTKKCKEI